MIKKRNQIPARYVYKCVADIEQRAVIDISIRSFNGSHDTTIDIVMRNCDISLVLSQEMAHLLIRYRIAEVVNVLSQELVSRSWHAV